MLFLSVIRTESTYFDGNQLYEEVLNYMLRLNKCILSINTQISNKRVEIDLPSNNRIWNSFIKRGFQSIDTCTDDILTNSTGN